MCMVSAVHDNAAKHPWDWWDKNKWDEFEKVVKQAREYDRKTGQPDCIDPAKEKLVRDVLDYLRKEGKLK